jgi:hypothetical protein
MWENIDKSNPDGAHYSIMRKQQGVDGMTALRGMFPDAVANEMNLVLFSTSGVHGTYNTIEEAEATINGTAEEDDQCTQVTFLVVHPRLVALRYGVCYPASADDIDYLKRLRASSHEQLAKIGMSRSA